MKEYCEHYTLDCQAEKMGCEGCGYFKKSADEIFEELDYIKEYYFSPEGEKIGENYMSKAKDIEITFYYVDKEFCISSEGDYAMCVGIDELKAINKRVEELGWK